MSPATIFFDFASSPAYMSEGRRVRHRVSYTANSTSLGTVPNAETTRAPRAFLARDPTKLAHARLTIAA